MRVISDARLAFSGIADVPVRASAAEELLKGGRPSPELFAEAAQAATAGIDPPADLHGSQEYRKKIAVVTNKASYIAYRGPWASETFVRERVIDLFARDLGLDPFEVRLRNAAPRVSPPLTMVTGRPLVGVTTKESLELIADAQA